MILTDSLAECARRRGVPQLPHRTIREFAWFVDKVIYGWEDEDMDKYYPRGEDWFGLTVEEKLEAWGEAFLSYYLDKGEGEE